MEAGIILFIVRKFTNREHLKLLICVDTSIGFANCLGVINHEKHVAVIMRYITVGIYQYFKIDGMVKLYPACQ